MIDFRIVKGYIHQGPTGRLLVKYNEENGVIVEHCDVDRFVDEFKQWATTETILTTRHSDYGRPIIVGESVGKFIQIGTASDDGVPVPCVVYELASGKLDWHYCKSVRFTDVKSDDAK